MPRQINMEQPHHDVFLSGVLTVVCGIWSWIAGAMTSIDGGMLVLLHFFQILVAICGIVAAGCTASPTIKGKVEGYVKRIFGK